MKSTDVRPPWREVESSTVRPGPKGGQERHVRLKCGHALILSSHDTRTIPKRARCRECLS